MKLKRLVSAILAVGMALTMLPTAAFAADEDNTGTGEVQGLEITSAGQPLIPSDIGTITVDGVTVKREMFSVNLKLHKCTSTGWSCQVYEGKPVSNMTIDAGYTYAGSENPVKITFNNNGTVTGGSYGYFANSGTVTGGYIQDLKNESTGKINGGTYGRLNHASSTSGEINTAIFLNEANLKEHNVAYHTLTATGGHINKTAFSVAYIVGRPTVTVSFTDKRHKVSNWRVNGEVVNETTLPDAVVARDGDNVTLTFTMPDDKDIEISVDKVTTPLKIENGVPVDELGYYGGDAKNDGWTYNGGVDTDEVNKRFVTEETFAADLKGNTVKWVVTNNGTLENGTIDNTITNYGTVKDITATWYFNNYGTIESGVFSRMANFGKQNPAVRWVSVNGGTVNGMDVAGIVGEQTVTVKADTGFKCWSVSGDTDFALTDEQKYNPELTLTLNGEDKGNIILTAQTEEGYYRLNLTDGKTYSATADGVKDQEINAARPGDTVILEADASLIPDGMVFDRWEVTGDTELTGSFDAKAEKTSFTMPKSEVTLRAMYRMADQPEEPNVLGTVAMVATAGVGAAVVGYTGYMIGTELYLNTVLPDGVAIPQNTAELAKLVWTEAGKPAPAAVMAPDATDEQKALTWAIENQLISADKAADASVGRWEVIQTWNKAQEMKG